MRRLHSVPLALLLAAGCAPPDAEPETSTTTDPSGADTESESTTTTTTESSTTVIPDPETDDFVPNHDDGFAGLSCDPFAQDCIDGEKCVPYDSGGDARYDDTKCVPIVGDGSAGESCLSGGPVESTDDCDADSYCWNAEPVDSDLVGTCVPFCMGTADDPECPIDTACFIAFEGSVTLCLASCDPLVQDCPEGQGCHWGVDDFVCLESDLGPVMDDCAAPTDCAPGLSCIDAMLLPACGGDACCTPWCDLQLGDDDCVAYPGTVCVPYFEMPPPGFNENVGVCLMP